MSGWADAPLIDPAQMEGYVDLLSITQVTALAEAFEHELATRPAMIVDLVATGEIDAARAAAHRLRGAALTIGATRLAALAGAIDTAPSHDLPALASELSATAQATGTAMAANPA